jgi:Cof subfamily protein (haloacid dehalogenase superfamily)
MYQLIAVDVDGTLINASGKVSSRVSEAIQFARKKGALVTLISGRTRVHLKDLVTELEISIPFSGSNGAFIAQPGSNEIVAHFPFACAEAAQVVALATQEKAIGICFHYIDQAYYDPLGYDWISRNARRWIAHASVVDTNTLTLEAPMPGKINLMGEEETLHRMAARIHRELPEVIINLGMTPQIIEINAAGVTKGAALVRLGALLNVPISRTAAVGDGGNDISMLQQAGLSIAMGNASPEVKAAAQRVAPSVDEDGLAWAIQEALQ